MIYAFSLLTLLDPLSNVFPKELSIWFVIFVAGLKIISPCPRYSEQVCSIVVGLLFSFPEKFAQGPTQSCWWDVCGPYFWHLQCLWNCHLWLAVFTVLRSSKDGRYGFKIPRKHWRLAFVFSLVVSYNLFITLYFKHKNDWAKRRKLSVRQGIMNRHS